RLHDIAAGQMEVGRIGRQMEKLWIGHDHATIQFLRTLHHLTHVVMETRAKAHLAGRRSDLVEACAHGFKRARSASLTAPRREHYKVSRSELLEESHGCFCIGDHFGAASGVVRGTVKRNRNDLAPASGGFFRHLRWRYAVCRQYLGELRQPDADEAGIL